MHWREFQEWQKVSELGDRFISYVDRGEGPPVILLHGMPTWGYLWHRLLPALERGRRVLIPDLQGFGFSDRRDRFGRGLSCQADMVAAWMESLGLEKADLVGHDLGGGVALRLAALQPARVRRLCLIDSVCYDSWPHQTLLQFGHPGTARRLSAPAAMKLLASALKPAFVEPDEALLAGLLAPYATEQGKLSLVRNASALDSNATMELSPLLMGVQARVLVLWGEADPFQSAALGRRLAWDLPRARLVVVRQAGHFLPLERAEQTASHLLDFLDSV